MEECPIKGYKDLAIAYTQLKYIAQAEIKKDGNYVLPPCDFDFSEEIYDACPEDMLIDGKIDFSEFEMRKEAWWIYIMDLSKEDREITEEEENEIFDFLENPTESVRLKNKILSKIPNIIELTRVFEAHCQKAYAGLILENSLAPIILQQVINEAPNTLKIKGQLECWISLIPNSQYTPNEMGGWILNLEAIFVDNTGQFETIATVSGYHIITTSDYSSMDDQDFMYMMDAHSARLCDVGKVVLGEFLPNNGIDALELFCGEEGCESASIATVTIEISPKYRGNRLSKFIFETIKTVIINLPLYVNNHTMEDILCNTFVSQWFNSYKNNADEFFPDNFYEGTIEHDIIASPIKLFVIPIEGTAPKGGMIRPELGMVIQKIPFEITDVDAKIELSRIRLNKYYSDVNEECNEIYIQTYNPWDYPVT